MKIPNDKKQTMLNQVPKKLILFVGFWIIFTLSCTENPITEDEKIAQNSISGRVALTNNADSKDVYVWFKALNVSARTDSTGHFLLNIPSPSQQPGGGIDGIFDLYFYVSNYKIKSVKIAIVRGNVKYDDQAINNNGELKETVVLTEILNINTSFSDRRSSESNVDTIYVTVTVMALEDPVKITSDFSYEDLPGDPTFMTGFLLNSEKKFVKTLKREDKGHKSSEIIVGNDAGSLKPITILIPQGEFPTGDYYVVPYIIVDQDLPPGLIESIGENVTKFSQDFMKIPLKIVHNKFQI